jgi:hypothetical protein
VSKARERMKQVVDWGAAIWAGLIGGIVFLLINMILTSVYLGSPWVIFHLIASILMGSGVIIPAAATFNPAIFLVSLIVHILLSIICACIIAIILHRWGLIVGIVGGAFFCLALYLIIFYVLSLLFPWFFYMRSWIMAISYVLFGAVAGGIYEALEVEEFVPSEE